MKYHKLHKASFRQSITLLMLMVVGITLPIACSDLRGTEAVSNEELEQTEISIQNPALSINGVELEMTRDRDLTINGLGAVQIITADYGLFKVAPRSFDGGTKVGTIKGNRLSFRISELNVELNSSGEILPGFSNAPIWVSHKKENVKPKANMLFPTANAMEEFPPAPPKPPMPPRPEKQEDLGDFFVIVEKMPVLIGGMKALQSSVEYPEMARRAGIEGRVTVQFIVSETGDVEHAQVVRGIGGGADEVALEAVKQAKFEPGMQRGQAVRVRYALSINFRLSDADYSTSPPSPEQN